MTESEEKPNKETKAKVARQSRTVKTVAQVPLNPNGERVAFSPDSLFSVAQCANFDPSEEQFSLQLSLGLSRRTTALQP
ncbi:hypothetical protein AVEN_140254-1 [Araneus ventricosus]|uniref:Uncharacterized protein n=1 Tax=Araneus ventricosus TaxID=182803 RepID=A0A4Y2LSS6_ARAVE|nr:hypothetical protein AVEN_140254-1 [Araneus ventricosus]